jgi:hypothetical protein
MKRTEDAVKCRFIAKSSSEDFLQHTSYRNGRLRPPSATARCGFGANLVFVLIYLTDIGMMTVESNRSRDTERSYNFNRGYS